MQRRLFSVSSALTATALAAVLIAVATFLPNSPPQSPSALHVRAGAAPASQDGAATHEESTARRSNRWGANYFPNVPVVDQDGHTLKFYDDVIKGKIVVISFIYTTCPDICPLTTARMAQLADMLGDTVGRDIFLISMTVDPETDTPEKMKAFADAYGAGPGWLFLTGKLEDIRAINSKLGDRSDRNLSDHRNEIVLGNDEIGDWERDSVFGDLNRLAITVHQMDPKWLNAIHVPEQQSAKKVDVVIPDHPGQALFKKMCAPCHSIGVGDRVGPDLRDVTTRRDRVWLTKFIENPPRMFAEKDPTALELAARFPSARMPALGIGDTDAKDLLTYLDNESAHITDGAEPTTNAGGHAHHHH